MNQKVGVGQPAHIRAAARIAVTLIWILGFASISAAESGTQTLTVAETELLVRAVHFEGMPEEDGRRVGPEGAARLIEMLGDPAESSSHANILIALGLSGQPGTLDVIADWATIPREGEIDRDEFRAWQALPYALSHAAQSDGRAVAMLEAKLEEDAPSWTFRHHRGARLHDLTRRAAATALGMTGLPAAGRVLDRAGRRVSDSKFEEYLRGARNLHARRAKDGRSQ